MARNFANLVAAVKPHPTSDPEIFIKPAFDHSKVFPEAVAKDGSDTVPPNEYTMRLITEAFCDSEGNPFEVPEDLELGTVHHQYYQSLYIKALKEMTDMGKDG